MKAAMSLFSFQRSPLNDLGTMWITIVIALTYLGVPVKNAPLFATALVMQGALGSAVLRSLLTGLPSSVLLLCGPGVIVGSSLSFIIFQLVGRGSVGYISLVLLGVVSSLRLARQPAERFLPEPRWFSVAQVLGLSALAMSSEFEWLVGAAIGLVITAESVGQRMTSSAKRGTRAVVALTAASLIVFARSFQGDFWWLITDDYLFFEVLMDHLATSSPFSDWGAVNFSSYHWLSYGWSAQLDHFAQHPDTLVTLTRAMPYVYSMVLAASLLLTTKFLQAKRSRLTTNVLTAWVVVSFTVLDWTGLSTAAVFSVIAATIAVLVFVADTGAPTHRRFVVYALFGAMISLTKAPAMFVIPSVVFTTECVLRNKARPVRVQIAFASLTSIVVSIFSFGFLPPASAATGGAFSLKLAPQSSKAEIWGSLLEELRHAVSGHSQYLLLILVAWMFSSRMTRTDNHANSHVLLLSISPLWIFGLLMDTLVVGNANTNEYFSGPYYFLSIACLLVIQPHGLLRVLGEASRRQICFLVGSIFLALAAGFNVDNLPMHWSVTGFFGGLGITLSLWFFVALILAWSLSVRSPPSVRSHFAAHVILAFAALAGVGSTLHHLYTAGPNPTLVTEKVERSLGPTDSETVGRWLRDNSPHDALVATNYLKTRQGTLRGDYSLAAWSRREFLVLGPSLGFSDESSSKKVSDAIEFAVDPAEQSSTLKGYGVSWYIVDLDGTTLRNWEPYAETMAMTQRFWVLRLR